MRNLGRTEAKKLTKVLIFTKENTDLLDDTPQNVGLKNWPVKSRKIARRVIDNYEKI